MDAAPRTPLMTTKAYQKLQKKLFELETEIIQFTNLPTDTPGLDHLAEDIEKKIAFFKRLLTAETALHDSTSHDFLEIEGKLDELESEFFKSNSPSSSVIVHENDDSEISSGSICDHCSSKEPQNDNWKVYENPAMVYEPEMFHNTVIPPSEMFHNTVIPSSEMFEGVVAPVSEKVHEAVTPPTFRREIKEASGDCERIQSGGGGKKQGRRWCRILAVLMAVYVVLMVVSCLIDDNEDGGFVTPT